MKKEHLDKRLSETQKWMIRRDFRDGIQQKAIAIKYGVSQATISLVCNPEAYQKKKDRQNRKYKLLKEGV